VVVAAARQPSHKIPWEEQLMAVAAAVQNMLLAATALGYQSMWRTGDPVYDHTVKAALGLHDDDAIVGFVYLGTPAPGSEKPPNEPILATDMVTHWRVP
jgi:nitroreductase